MRISISVGLRLIALAILITFSSVDVFPSEIPPQPLRELTVNSNLIVVGKVEYVIPLEQRDDDSTIARLEVKSRLKGTVNSYYIDVYYSAGIVCPTPPHYKVGGTVLAFLEPRKSGVGFHTVGLSYGS